MGGKKDAEMSRLSNTEGCGDMNDRPQRMTTTGREKQKARNVGKLYESTVGNWLLRRNTSSAAWELKGGGGLFQALPLFVMPPCILGRGKGFAGL